MTRSRVSEPSDEQLEITQRQVEDAVALTVVGEIDLNTAPQLDAPFVVRFLSHRMGRVWSI
ncbi:hypothetical protein [Amycolatopsis alkalitolerans]|uniref:Uncharacterized protein n=1 Tax=Amycolatopsis alkalitolerans TaxID=2547244 RepID=A0A5C4MBV9_9PSEU|nr:hypothetical protein [Amycolatopsis alkalitolerans]TNC29612.1 hypothetical protein FG385_01210 [Amycolatopsis alkalitolerans]